MSTAFATELERAIDIRGVIHATGPWENMQVHAHPSLLALKLRGVVVQLFAAMYTPPPRTRLQEVIRRAVRELYTAICSQDAKLSDIAVKAADSKVRPWPLYLHYRYLIVS